MQINVITLFNKYVGSLIVGPKCTLAASHAALGE